MPKVSVIIPVYGAERYIERCARSLFEQTLDDIEYIFVDDCTPDKSMEVLEKTLVDYSRRFCQVRIIRMPKNGKQAAARTAGMKAATGEYIIHCDPDDWLDLHYYEELYSIAVKHKADIVQGPFMFHEHGNVTFHPAPSFIGLGKEALRQSKYDWHLVCLLIRKSIIDDNNIYPYEGIDCGEDVNVAMRAYYFSDKVQTYSGSSYYHYNHDNPTSITNQSFCHNLEKYLKRNVELLDGFFGKYGEAGHDIMCRYKLRVKSPLLYQKSTRDIKMWYSLWPEVTGYYARHQDEFGIHGKMVSLGAKFHVIMKLYCLYLDLYRK